MVSLCNSKFKSINHFIFKGSLSPNTLKSLKENKINKSISKIKDVLSSNEGFPKGTLKKFEIIEGLLAKHKKEKNITPSLFYHILNSYAKFGK